MIRSKYTHMKRPILINNWEATYFDFNTEKLLSIAKRASELGIEMLVMDDGCFLAIVMMILQALETAPNSKLYEQHPDWAIAVPGRTATLSRNQYVLDLSRKEVRDYVYDMISNILHSANIEYVKWDMNRQLSDMGSYELPADRQEGTALMYPLSAMGAHISVCPNHTVG